MINDITFTLSFRRWIFLVHQTRCSFVFGPSAFSHFSPSDGCCSYSSFRCMTDVQRRLHPSSKRRSSFYYRHYCNVLQYRWTDACTHASAPALLNINFVKKVYKILTVFFACPASESFRRHLKLSADISYIKWSDTKYVR